MRLRYGRAPDTDDVYVKVFDTGAENKSLKTVYRQYCEFTFLDFQRAPIEESYNALTTLCSAYVSDWKKFLKETRELQWHAISHCCFQFNTIFAICPHSISSPLLILSFCLFFFPRHPCSCTSIVFRSPTSVRALSQISFKALSYLSNPKNCNNDIKRTPPRSLSHHPERRRQLYRGLYLRITSPDPHRFPLSHHCWFLLNYREGLAELRVRQLQISF